MEEAAAAVLASLDGAAAMAEDFSLQIRRLCRYLLTPTDSAFLRPLVALVRRVDWTEPWLLLVMVFHVRMLVVSTNSRDSNSSQMTLFTFGLMSVYLAEKVNRFLATNWSLLSRRPYFDSEGFFVSTVWSGPVLMIGSVILANSVHILVQRVLEWKNANVQRLARLSGKKRV